MKRLLIIFALPALLLSATYMHAQTRKQVKTPAAAATAQAAQNLSDDFAKASLKALMMIDSELGTTHVLNGELIVPRKTNEQIINADVEARTDNEKAVVSLLNAFFLARIGNNEARSLIATELSRDSQMAADPDVIDMNSREAACSRALDELLRKRYFAGDPPACNGVSRLPSVVQRFHLS